MLPIFFHNLNESYSKSTKNERLNKPSSGYDLIDESFCVFASCIKSITACFCFLVVSFLQWTRWEWLNWLSFMHKVRLLIHPPARFFVFIHTMVGRLLKTVHNYKTRPFPLNEPLEEGPYRRRRSPAL